MKNNKLLTIFIVLMLSLALLFVSCDKTGDETTGAPETTLAPSVTDTPTEPADETTSAPETTAEEITSAPETTKAEETTEAHHVHVWGELVTSKDPTCTEEGLSEQSCSCGEKQTFPVAVIAHTEGGWIEDKAPTCTDAGSKHAECTVCKTTVKTEPIPSKGHTDGDWIIDKEATATTDGSKHLECSVCKATIKTEVLPATPHTPGAWIVDKNPTCTETGLRHRECTKCGETVDTETISAKGHSEVMDKAKPATCTETGLTEGKHCSVCNTVIDAQNKVSAKGHTEVIDSAKPATCTETGLTEGKHCSVCNAVTKAQEKISAKGHSEVTDAAKAATCTAEGLTEGKHCSVCNTVIKAQEKIPVTAHIEAIDAAKTATCVETGLTEGKHCSVCNTVIKAQETVPTVAHTESDWIVDKAATTAEEGSKHIECTVCKTVIKTESIPKVEIPKVEYTVTVFNGNGTPAADVEVVFTKSGAEVAKVKTDGSGKAIAKLESDSYDFALHGADSYFVASDVSSLTSIAPNAKVTLVPYATSPELVYPGQADVAPSGNTPGVLAGVYRVDIGSYRLPVEKDKMRYVFFAPTEGARYRFYVDSDKVEIGYYGNSFFISSNNNGTILEDGTMELTVLHSSIGNTLVIGYKSTSSAATECTITIEKYADIGLTIEELDWPPYKADSVFEKIETPEGYIVGMDLAVLTPFDPAYSEIQVFFNEKDGYYHLESEDGPVLYVRIGSKSSYQDALTAIVGTSNLGRYIYDENGEFLRKESYNEIISAYAEAADTKYNVYPLDEDLYYILKGLEDIGWYDRTSPNYIFKEEEIIVMPYNGWLFACVYFK